jgi:Fe-S-cluster containining protein
MGRKSKRRGKTTEGADCSAEALKKASCRGCPALCCHDMVEPISRPQTSRDVEELKWQLQYDTIRVYIRSHRWYVIVQGRCMYLTDDNLCSIYERRPKRCRRYNPPDCERYGEYWDEMINTPQELDAYLEREKKRRAGRRRKSQRTART